MSVSRVNELPQKLLLRIFSFLDKGRTRKHCGCRSFLTLVTAGDLAKCGMTCKLFGRIHNHDSLWKRLFCKQWGESIGYAFVGSWKYRYRARLQYIQSRKRPEFLPSLRKRSLYIFRDDSLTVPSGLDTPTNQSADESSSSTGSSSSTAKSSTPVATHGHWLAEKIVDSQPKVGTFKPCSYPSLR